MFDDYDGEPGDEKQSLIGKTPIDPFEKPRFKDDSIA